MRQLSLKIIIDFWFHMVFDPFVLAYFLPKASIYPPMHSSQYQGCIKVTSVSLTFCVNFGMNTWQKPAMRFF